MTEDHFESTPYHYCFNNPVLFIDPFGLDTISSNEVDWPEFDPESDVIEIDEVVVKPTNDAGVDMIKFTMDKEEFMFTKHGNPLYAPDNTIENYLYYLKHPEDFVDEDGNPVELNKIFKSESEQASDLGEDILLEIADIFSAGAFSSGDVVKERQKQRRSKYSDKFPSNKRRKKAKEKKKSKWMKELASPLKGMSGSPEDLRYKN